MPSTKTKTLLVGSDGYIGSNCTFDCDKMDVKSDTDFFGAKPRQYDTIIFLASLLGSTLGDYQYNEELYYWLDIWLEHYPETHVIYSSSAAVYGDTDWANKENQLPEPINWYGKSKLSGEFRVREYKRHTVLRFGNVYDKLSGQDGHGVTELFKRGERTIFGDGEQVRDFVPIMVIWEVIEMAKNNPEVWQGVFNVSINQAVTINDWYSRIGLGLPEHLPPREGDIYVSKLDNSKMKAGIAACV